ncbi:MAG: hypothetical protein WAW23_07895 [Candidatus Methanoperedens sp.]
MVQRHLLIKYLNKVIDLETGRGTIYNGKITDFDEWGVNFIPNDKNLKPAIISWDDIRKVILVEHENNGHSSKRSSIF